MGNQNQEQKWFDFRFFKIDCQIDIAVMSVFEKGTAVETDRPIFVDPVGRTKIYLASEGNVEEKCLIFQKHSEEPPYHELNLKFPKGAILARENEDKPFDIRNKDKDFGYCYLRIQPGAYFEGVYLLIDGKVYKVFVKEYNDTIKVFLWENPKRLPSCLRRR
ncbi:MAG: hypothetical protein NTV62_01910 [Candidatus Gribaldobacteria bacterium]|nr:hypothetical protein [Candidatus Gribaldobacteria bacterium]